MAPQFEGCSRAQRVACPLVAQGILGNIWRKVEAELPGAKTGSACLNACVYGCPIACYNKPEQKCAGADVAQGQNAGVSNGVKRMSYEQASCVADTCGRLRCEYHASSACR